MRRQVEAGEYLFRQGEGPPPDVFYLISATAEILVGSPGEERAVSLSRPGQLVGWLTVFTTEPFPASARVVEPGDLLQFPAEVFRRLLDRHPSVGQILAATMARRLEDLFQQIRREAAQSSLGRAETFLFRKRVSEVMQSPAITLSPEASARAAAQAMGEAQASAVLVANAQELRGIVTEADLIQKVLAEGLNSETVTLAAVMSSPVSSLPPDAYLYKALGLMRRRGVRHLAVVDSGRMVGALSLKSLMTMGSSQTLELSEQIEGAQGHAALGAAHRHSLAICGDLLEEGVSADEVSGLLSHINRDIHRRALELAVSEMEGEGLGSPPIPFCFIVMGSHGRAECHLDSDQDHGMILADYPPADWHRVEPYFLELGTRVSQGLVQVGFPLCRGHVMSLNPAWRKPFSEWKKQVGEWYANPTYHAVRYTTLLYDFQPVWGDGSLARDLRDFLTEGIRENFPLLRGLFREASRHRVPLTLFKNFVTERSGPHKGELDVKRSGMLFVVECARILALRHGVAETSTPARLAALALRGAIPPEEAEFVCTAYRTLFHFLLTAQARRLRAGEPPDPYVAPQTLPIQERYLLRHALEATGRLQGLVHASFGDVFF
ncbi:MAG: CBS domain-containing protein [Proteobacteria bacterium]|nr:CBS domain-containing protein [Pseudomonadota bacterium]